MDSKYIVLYTRDNFDWNFYVALSLEDAKRTVANLTKQGVTRYSTHYIGDRIVDLSSEY